MTRTPNFKRVAKSLPQSTGVRNEGPSERGSASPLGLTTGPTRYLLTTTLPQEWGPREMSGPTQRPGPLGFSPSHAKRQAQQELALLVLTRLI